MDIRDKLLGLLNKYKPIDSPENKSKMDIIEFVKSNPKCFDNDYKLGHITGSASVVDEKIEYALLTYHPHFDKWLQFCGHSDGLSDVLRTGYREAQEESGLKSLKFITGHEGIIDLDVHPIPPGGGMPLHNHYDVRIILMADRDEHFVVSRESKELKWVKLENMANYNTQKAFLRLVGKAIKLRKELKMKRLQIIG